ncbi:hypothetical protein J6590_074496 [Homalodisca vitripennis]|nr:hypothetical protein J6590_074496 [Homalodisca vitripennis]
MPQQIQTGPGVLGAVVALRIVLDRPAEDVHYQVSQCPAERQPTAMREDDRRVHTGKVDHTQGSKVVLAIVGDKERIRVRVPAEQTGPGVLGAVVALRIVLDRPAEDVHYQVSQCPAERQPTAMREDDR